MAFTATTLKAAMQSYLQTDEASFVAMQDTIIKQAEDRISKAVILPANRKNVDLTLMNGTPTVDLPDDFLALFEFRINELGEFSPVAYQDVSYIREVFPSPLYVGIPRFYSMFNATQFVMAPSPTSGLTGWLNYFYKPESIVDADESWLGSNAENCLLYACLAEAYTYLKGEPDLMKTYEEKFQTALGDLKTLGEGMDLGDAWRFGERRISR